ncbi:LysR family transcriptional regulator substrate-binding protein [Gordonia shandongensis]|uniref:LysR family transcriptional regulator substrate-binding protein n=1 Tax=Gordonia shandongensis TaxID=376351 RepID=UPI00041BAD00|nr:LysR family transcriptional regulator substrate-binding protein [Gordonia shandongensis]
MDDEQREAGDREAGAFRLAYVPGATPGKWARVWAERLPDVALQLIACTVDESIAALACGEVEAALTRIPVDTDALDPGRHHVIELYEETTVLVVGKDHYLTLGDELTLADVADEQFLMPLDDPLQWVAAPGAVVDHRPATTADAVELVAAGVGVLAVPQSLARLHHRRDLVYRPITDAPVSRVGLVWPSPTSDLADELVGIVRGRRPGSSRGQNADQPKRTARQKAAARRANREAADPRRGPTGRRSGGRSGGRRKRR